MQQVVQMAQHLAFKNVASVCQGLYHLCLVLTSLFCVVPLSSSVTRNIALLLSKVENLDFFDPRSRTEVEIMRHCIKTIENESKENHPGRQKGVTAKYLSCHFDWVFLKILAVDICLST